VTIKRIGGYVRRAYPQTPPPKARKGQAPRLATTSAGRTLLFSAKRGQPACNRGRQERLDPLAADLRGEGASLPLFISASLSVPVYAAASAEVLMCRYSGSNSAHFVSASQFKIVSVDFSSLISS
jgi:hypothetical protein